MTYNSIYNGSQRFHLLQGAPKASYQSNRNEAVDKRIEYLVLRNTMSRTHMPFSVTEITVTKVQQIDL